MLKVFAKSQVLRRTPGPQGKELMEISSTMQMQVVLYVTPGRLADEMGGGTRYKLPGPGARRGPGRYVAYVSVFLDSVVCWLYKLTLSDQAHSTTAETLLDLAGPPLPGRRVRKNFFTGVRTRSRRP
jgi:hypothetical protein